MLTKDKHFNLIELIIVIVVLGIMASIVIPNINGLRNKAEVSYLESSERNIQTAVDMYRLEHFNLLPVEGKEQPILGKPKKLDFKKIDGEYLKNNIKLEDCYAWVDYSGEVTISKVDAPVGFHKEEIGLTWIQDSNVVSYNIYEISKEETLGSSNKVDVKLLGVVKQDNTYTPDNYDKNKEYAISAVDFYGHSTPHVIEGYSGYGNSVHPTETVDTATVMEFSLLQDTPENEDVIVSSTKQIQSSKEMQFSTATFTTANWTGPTGPSQNQINAEYKGTILEDKVTSLNGVQLWSVPQTGTYRIEAYGAEGGAGFKNYVGGKGAIMIGEFSLTKGTLLNIVVGQTGGTANAGGGGSFVWIDGSSRPLIVAGGGGGASGHPLAGGFSNGIDATTSQNGTSAGSIAGGLNGGAGKAGDSMGANGLNGSGGGGSGWREDALGGKLGEEYKALKQGGRGGSGGGASGGFGGGGSAWLGGGGGGGYSGGAGGTWGASTGGGGGGSYNSGSNQSNTAGANTGNGKVVVTLVK